jgi:hypothetical protein
MKQVYFLSFLITVLFHCSCGDISTEEKSATTNVSPPSPHYADTSVHKPERPAPKYTIIRNGSTYTDYEVLIDPVDLNSIAYKKDVKAIIDDIAYSRQQSSFTASIYDDAKAAELYHRRREEGQGLNPKETELVNKHIVAMYTKDFDGVRRISYFENVPADEKSAHKAWKDAFNQKEFNRGYKPR